MIGWIPAAGAFGDNSLNPLLGDAFRRIVCWFYLGFYLSCCWSLVESSADFDSADELGEASGDGLGAQ
jgi:hypothetical protein